MPRYPKDSKDKLFVQFPPEHMVSVSMSPVHADAYQRWLRANGLHLFAIPGSDFYGIAVRDERMGQPS